MLKIWEELPDALIVNGETCMLYTDFKHWMQIETILFEDTMTFVKKIPKILQLAYKTLPSSVSYALSGVAQFYTGQSDGQNPFKETKMVQRQYSFLYDGDLLYAAFRQQYGIDLYREELHWWQFRALLCGLSETTAFMQAVGYRRANISGIQNKEFRDYARQMKRKYALPDMYTEAEKEQMLATEIAAFF